MKNISIIWKTGKKVLQQRNYLLLFLVSAAVMNFLYIYLPIYLTPSNTWEFFVELTPWWGFALFTILAFLVGLLIAFNVYSFRQLRAVSVRSTASGIVGTASSIVSGMFSSATCAYCISALFAFLLPPAALLTLLEYRYQIVAGGFVLVLLALFLTAKKIEYGCDSCHVPRRKKRGTL